MNAYIKAISYYLPQNRLTNEQLIAEFPEWSVEKVALKVGINERRVVTKDECASDLAVKAAENLFEEYSIDRLKIDFILFCTQSPDYFLPTTACIIQDRLGIPTSAGALDFNLGCSGYIYGLSLAKGLVIAGIAKNILFLTAETYTKFLHPKDKGNRTIFGDAATASIISTNGFAKIENFSLGTDGRGANNLIVRNGASRNNMKSNEIVFDEGNNPISPDYLYMNGSEIFNFTLEAVPSLIENILQKNGLIKKDIDLFIFHQANLYILNFLRKKIKIDEDKFNINLEKFGNTVSSTIPIALKEAIAEGKLISGANILLAGFGVGYSWGGTILSIEK